MWLESLSDSPTVVLRELEAEFWISPPPGLGGDPQVGLDKGNKSHQGSSPESHTVTKAGLFDWCSPVPTAKLYTILRLFLAIHGCFIPG